MSESIINGSQGIDTSDATANNSQILSGATAYVNGVKVTGNMPNRGSWGTSISPGSSVTIPSGYHSGGGSVYAGTASPTGPYCYMERQVYIQYGTTQAMGFSRNESINWATNPGICIFDRYSEYGDHCKEAYYGGNVGQGRYTDSVSSLIGCCFSRWGTGSYYQCRNNRITSATESNGHVSLNVQTISLSFGPMTFGVSSSPVYDHASGNTAYFAMPYYVRP